MWPLFLCTTKDECLRSLRQLELEAYSMLVSALRAQGPLTPDKQNVLRETGKLLNISLERHKCEIRRAINDEKLNTIAYHMNGAAIPMEDWCMEGRSLLPMLQRISPQTLHPILAENLAHAPGVQLNYQEIPYPTFGRKKQHITEVQEPKMEPIFEGNSSENITTENELVQEMHSETAEVHESPLITKPKLYKHITNQSSSMELDKVEKTYSTRKIINKNQKFMIVSSTETIPSNSILHKTLSLPITKVTKLNPEKFKIVPSSNLQISSSGSAHVGNQNVITSKTGKKIIPLSQLQMLNHKLSSKGGIKVLPISSKIFGKNITMTRITNQHGLKTSVLQPFTQNSRETSCAPKIKVESIEPLPSEIPIKHLEGDTDEGSIDKYDVDSSHESQDANNFLENEKKGLECTFTGTVIKKEDTAEIKDKNDEIESGDLASLMEIDTSEFIEPELKEHIILKKET